MQITVLPDLTPFSVVKCNKEVAGSSEMCTLLPFFWMSHPSGVTFNITKI